MSQLDFIRWDVILALVGFIVVSTCLGVFCLTLTESSYRFWLSESGVFEVLSAVGYAGALGLMLWRHRANWIHYLYLYVIALALLLRELDWDKRFTSMGVFKSRFFSSSQVPLIEKVFGALVIALILWALYRLIKVHAKPVIKQFFEGELQAWLVAIFFIIGVVSKSLDGLARKLEDFGIQITVFASDLASATEEILELGLPLILIFMVLNAEKKIGQFHSKSMEC